MHVIFGFNSQLRFPSAFSLPLRDLLKNLVCFDVTQRFGMLKNGVHDIKDHEWFKDLNWEALAAQQLPAPYVPKISVSFGNFGGCE